MVRGRRHAEAIRLHQLYEGDTIGGGPIDPGGADYQNDSSVLAAEPIEQMLNICQDIVDTAVSKLTLENNKSQIVVTDGSWEVRRQAILADRFIEGQFHERQGKFYDLWDMFQHALRLALASTKTTAVKFFSDEQAGRIQAELHDCLSMWVDVSGQTYDYPTSMGEVTYWDPDKLISKYPEAEEEIIRATGPVRIMDLGLEALDYDYDYRSNDVQRVRVVEGWRFKAYGKPGKYCMAIQGKVLEWMDYDYEDPPFVFVGGVRSLTGFWHRTITKSITAPILRTNEILNSVNASERLTPKAVMYYDPEETPKEQLETVDDVILVPVPGLNTGRGKPQYEHPPPFHPLVMDLIRFYKEQAYELSGVSQMHTTGDVKGQWSGVALRIKKQLLIERFAPIQRAFIQSSCIEASKQIIRCAKELAEVNPKFASTWKGEGFMKEISVEVLSILDKEKYTVDVYAVSETKNTPEDRVSLAEELMSGGIITGEAFIGVLQHYDTVGETQVNASQRRYVSKQIEKWLFSAPKELTQKGFYRGPIKSMNLFSAIVQVNKAYLDAMTDEVDQNRLNFFGRWLKQCQKFLEEKQARAAAIAQSAGGSAQAAQGAMQAQGEPQMAA